MENISKNEQQTGSAARKKASIMETPVTKGKKLDVKRVKQRTDLNASKLNRTAATPKNFNSFGFLNMSIQKQTLRANNKALAQNLAKTKQELRLVNNLVHELKSEKQELQLSLNRLQRLVGLKDEHIEEEVKLRMKEQIGVINDMVEELTQHMFDSGKCLTELQDRCIEIRRQGSRPSTDRTSCDSVTGPSSEQRSINIQKAKRGIHQVSPSADTSKDIIMRSLSTSKTVSGSQATKNRADGLTSTMFNAGNPSNHTDISMITEQSILNEPCNDSFESLPSVMEAQTESSTVSYKKIPRKVTELPQRVKKSEKQNTKERVSNESDKLSEKTALAEKDCTPADDLFSFGEESVVLVSGSPIKDSDTNKQEEKVLDARKVVDSSAKGATRSKEKAKTSSKDRNSQKASDKTKASSKNTLGKGHLNVKDKTKKKVPSPAGERSRRNTYTATNPFVPKSTRVLRSPTRTNESNIGALPESLPVNPSKHAVTVDPINPFKPTKTLLRSPIAGLKVSSTHDQVDSPIQKINSQEFLAKLSENLDNNTTDAEPLPEPSFPDEQTVFLNSDMELTSVIDISRLAQANKKSPLVPMTDVAETAADSHKRSEDIDQAGTSSATRSGSRSSNLTSKSHENGDSTSASKTAEAAAAAAAAEAAVEMRNLKPGVFTFKVSRKEADGSRKPVPEKVNRARSKKKPKVLMEEEKEERVTGEDRDMFNFGDRTPTVPLEKLTKPVINVYDVSMNESVAAPKVSLNSFREKMKETNENTNVGSGLGPPQESNKDGEVIYHLPLKGSSDDFPTNYKPRSRSKSRKRDSSDDEDWVPDQRSKSRTRSKSKRKLSSDTENDDSERKQSLNHSSRKRQKSGTNNESPAKNSRRSGRSRSRPRIIDSDNDEFSQFETVERKSRSKDRNEADIKKSSVRSKSKSKMQVDSDEEVSSKTETVRRSARSKSRPRIVISDTDTEEELYKKSDNEKCKETVSKSTEPVTRAARSKSRARNVVVSDEVEDKDVQSESSDQSKSTVDKPVETVKRFPRSRSRHRKYDLSDEENLSDVKDREKISPEKVTKRSRRSKSRPRTFVKENETDDTEVISTSGAGKNVSQETGKKSQLNNLLKSDEKHADDTEIEIKELEEEPRIYHLPLKGSPVEKPTKSTEKTARSRSRSRVRDTDTEETTVTKSRSKSKSRRKSVDKDNIESIEITQQTEVTKHKKRVSAKSSESSGLVLPVFDIANADKENGNHSQKHSEIHTDDSSQNRDDILLDENNDIRIEDDFINHNRRKTGDRKRTLKTPKVDSDDQFKVPNSKSTKSLKTVESKRAKSKSGSGKNVKKQKADVDKSSTPRLETKTAQDTGKSTRKRLDQTYTETSEDMEPVMTPQEQRLSESTSKKELSKSKSAKRTKDKGSQDKADENTTPTNSLANLRRQLSMLPSKSRNSMVEENRVSLDKQPMSDRMSYDNIETEDDPDADAKRTRRNRPQISYCAMPLNKKLRQGDGMFETKLSKEKAEKARLLLTKKMAVKSKSDL